MNKDLISVIITVYNEAQLLYRCVFSVINQTYEKLEIIIVDDGSDDETASICEHISCWDHRIKVYHKTNEGLSEARNFGINKSHGKYICFLDADDWVDNDIYEELYNAIIKYKTKMSMCKMRKIYPTKIIDLSSNEPSYLANESVFMHKILFDWNEYGNYAWNKMYEKSLFENIKFPYGRLYEDKYIMYELALKSKNVAILSKSYYNYQIRLNSITGTINLKHLYDDMDSYKKLLFDNRLDCYKDELFNAFMNSANWFIIRLYVAKNPNWKKAVRILNDYYCNFCEINPHFCNKFKKLTIAQKHPIFSYGVDIISYSVYLKYVSCYNKLKFKGGC